MKRTEVIEVLGLARFAENTLTIAQVCYLTIYVQRAIPKT